MTDINKYMNKKLIQTIIYSGEISSILDDEELRLGMSTSEFVDDLYEFVSANLENPHIEGTHLRDLATLVSEVRFLTDERKKANEIVSMVNKTSEEGQKKFLRREFIKRFSLNPFLGNNLQIFCQYVLPQMQNSHLFSSISYDFILLDQLVSTDPLEMGEVITSTSGLEQHAINTINAVKSECKTLFSDECFDVNQKILLMSFTKNDSRNIRLRAKASLTK